jgi:uncharacterized protein (DUF2141 family)
MSKLVIGAALAAAVFTITPPALAQTPAAPAAAAPAAGTATLTLNLRNLKFGKGSAMIALYKNESDWVSNNVEFRKQPATGRNIDVTYTGLTPGMYAAKIFYDVNDNGKFDQGEPVAYTHDAAMNQSGREPQFSDASFQVSAGANKQTIFVPDIKINKSQ